MTFLFQCLYGMQMSTYCWPDIKLYKTYLLKIIDSIKHSIDENVTTDISHLLELHSFIERTKKNIALTKDENQCNQAFIEGVVRLFFLLIGEMPMRIDTDLPTSGIINSRKNWKLSKFRSVQFTQNPDQKSRLILSKLKREKEFESIKSVFYQIGPSAFIDWIKKYHPEIYLELF